MAGGPRQCTTECRGALLTLHSFVDWISTTVSAPLDPDGTLHWLDDRNKRIMQRQAYSAVSQQLGFNAIKTLYPSGMEDIEVGRMPYKYQTVSRETNTRIMFDPGLAHILVEITGTGCQELTKADLLLELLSNTKGRVTRVDVSADVKTEVSPFEFAKQRDGARFRAIGTFASESGETVYIGSHKSDRYAAVYRYAPPHPRSDNLRIEHRFKGKRAKETVEYILSHGLAETIAACGGVFGWCHPLWNPLVQSFAPLVTERLDKQSADAIRWLLTQVFPAMRRYEEQGIIPDLQAFVQEHLFSDQEAAP